VSCCFVVIVGVVAVAVVIAGFERAELAAVVAIATRACRRRAVACPACHERMRNVTRFWCSCLSSLFRECKWQFCSSASDSVSRCRRHFDARTDSRRPEDTCPSVHRTCRSRRPDCS